MSGETHPRASDTAENVQPPRGGMTSIPGRCERSVNGGDYICTREHDHDGLHRCFGMASWPDDEAEDDLCAHQEVYALHGDEHRCEVCFTVLREIEVTDPSVPHVWLTDITTTPTTNRMVRYEVVERG